MKILYFTATGNSLYVAKSLGGELLSIPQMIQSGTYEFTDDKIGIVFPLYEWSVNVYVADFLKKAKFNTDYLFGIATYGIFSGGVASHLMDIGNIYGHKFSYINKIKMVDNYLPGFSMKKQMENEYKKNIEAQISIVQQDIDQEKAWIVPESAIRKKLTKTMVGHVEKRNATPSEKGIKKIVRVEDSCIKCGICTQVCAVNNISFHAETGKIVYGDNCFSCYACLQNCPKNAIHIKSERDRSRFRNGHITLKEIVDSNS